MMSLRKKIAIALAAAGVAAGGFTVPAMAKEQRLFDAARLDKAQAEYTQYYRGYRGYRGGYYGYRGGWHGPSRGAAIAGAVGLGILGAAAVAANNRAYYYDDGYYAPPPPPVYAYPRRYYAPYGYYAPYDFRDNR